MRTRSACGAANRLVLRLPLDLHDGEVADCCSNAAALTIRLGEALDGHSSDGCAPALARLDDSVDTHDNVSRTPITTQHAS